MARPLDLPAGFCRAAASAAEPEPAGARARRWTRLLALALAVVLGLIALVLLPEYYRLLPTAFRRPVERWGGLGLLLASGAVLLVRPACLAGRADPVQWWGRLDALAAVGLRRGLPVVLGLLGIVQLATWVPHYLTWPWWVDLDCGARLALAWEHGVRPYRDIPCFQFPGQIYLFWLLGKTVGWGGTAAIYVVDVTLLLLLGGVLLVWSRRQFGGPLPALVAYLAFLSYYLGLNTAHVAQRDWHASALAVLALLTAQGWPGRSGRLASALAFALALTFRPQVVLFLPALALALDDSARPPGAPWAGTFRAAGLWGLALAATLALCFAPLILGGLIDDFATGLLQLAPETRYSQLDRPNLVGRVLAQPAMPLVLLALILSLPLAVRAAPAPRRLAAAWLAALALVLLYKPLSPVPHAYLDLPLRLVVAINLGVLTGLLLRSEGLRPAPALVALLLVLSQGVTLSPQFCSLSASRAALTAGLAGGSQQTPPLGQAQPFYRWDRYQALLTHLRRATGPRTRVANILKKYPAINGPVARVPVFPLESFPWLWEVAPGDVTRCLAALERTPDSVVVWNPREWTPGESVLVPAIRRLYVPGVRFGEIEVWRRRAGGVAPLATNQVARNDVRGLPGARQ